MKAVVYMKETGYEATALKANVCSTVDMNTHGGHSWQHVLVLLGTHML